MEDLGRNLVEEQLDRKDKNDEVVEPSEQRDVVGNDVPSEDEIACRAGENRLAADRRPIVAHQRPDEPGI